VIDVEHYERHRLLTLTHPDRLVVDVYGPRTHAERLRWPRRPGTAARPTGRLPINLRPLRTVVIDAGHGGRDPGAIGVGGLREKDVTLRLARAVGSRLQAEGFEVVYTRDGDRTIGLEERTAIAEAARGDLFVSIHANAAPRRSVRGVETYYLDEDHERHNLTVAARENGIEPHQVDDLQRALAKFRVAETSVQSRHLATLVQRQVVAGGHDRHGSVPDLGVKKGPFYVLFLSDMPAILLEVGFVTNRDDARRLRDRAYLEWMATQIAAGVTRYRDALPTVALGAGE
jgi:N-acetylmuramoyl-L-alanine amidase